MSAPWLRCESSFSLGAFPQFASNDELGDQISLTCWALEQSFSLWRVGHLEI